MHKSSKNPYKRMLRAWITIVLTAAFGGLAYGQSQDALLDKLVEKGIITVGEATALKSEADEGFRKSHQVRTGQPDWVSSLDFVGDLRGRYEFFSSDEGTPEFVDRHRFRYRLRFGVTAVIQDAFEVGFRLGSGDASASGGFIDPISSNQTFENNGAKKGIYIDLAYAKWAPIKTADWQFTLIGGKMENPFVFSDLVFDRDYTPEGIAQQLNYTLNDNHALKLNLGGFMLDEAAASSRDPYMLGAQLRWDAKWGEQWASTMGVAGLLINHDEGLNTNAVPNINVGNARNSFASGSPAEGFNPVVADLSLTYLAKSAPKYPGAFPIRFDAEFMHNPAAQADKDGWSLGILFGKAGKKKTWEVGYRWKVLEQNAWFEEVVDSDTGSFYGAALPNSGRGTGYQAGTNLRGHVFRLGYSPYDFLIFNVTYFLTETINELPTGTGSDISRLQVDATLKF